MRGGQKIYQPQRDMSARGRVKTRSQIHPKALCHDPQRDGWWFFCPIKALSGSHGSPVWLTCQEAERKNE